MENQSIETCVMLAMQSNQQAINELYARTVKKAYFVAKRILNDEEQVADIVQDSYIKALGNLHQLSEPAKFQGWLDTIIINKCKDYLRKNKPLLFSQLEGEEDASLNFEDTGVQFSPEAAVDYKETKRLVGEMIDRLPEDQKLCLLMFHYEEMSLNEIASIMDCPVNTVKSRLNYARKNLKAQVLELEKKGTKLYCMPLVPFLYWLFRQEAVEFVEAAITGAAATGMTAGVTGAVGNTTSAAGTTSAAATAAAGIGGMKLLLIAAGAAGVVFGGTKVYQGYIATPERTIERFEDAYNDYDVDKMLECLVPSVQQQYKVAKGVINLFGINPSDLMAGIIQLSEFSGIQSDISTVDIVPVEVRYGDSSHAQVTIHVFWGKDRDNYSEYEMQMQKVNGKWYIVE